MISRIRGKLLAKAIDRVEVVTSGGVAYELNIPATLYERLPRLGAEVELHAALVAREDGLELFGFQNQLGRRLFLRLQSASGVGPRLALALLGAMSAEQLIAAIRERDLIRLQSVSGVGKKKAERIALELADKLEDMAAGAVIEGREGTLLDAAVSALIALGYSRGESEGAVRRVLTRRDGNGLGVENLVREALAGMS